MYDDKMLPKPVKFRNIVTRTHGHDLYDERLPCGRIPFRKWIYERSDRLCLISEDGFNYISERYPQYADKYEIDYLGTNNYSICDDKDNSHTFTMASCSYVIPIKRVERIVTSLAEINDAAIEWYHFGAGQDFEKLKTLCYEKLENKPNVKVHLMGQVNNADLMKFYKANKIDLFVNVSEREGLPVSIMEALSFGIPIVATDVGSSRETISDGENGILLRSDFSDEELTSAIIEYAKHSDKIRKQQSAASRRIWENKFSAAKNYPEFMKTHFER